MKLLFNFDFSNQLCLKKSSLGTSQRGGSCLCADRALHWELTDEGWGSKLEQSHWDAGRGGDRGKEGVDKNYRVLEQGIKQCVKRRKGKGKSRHSDVAESTNVICLDFNKALDTDSNDDFITKLEDECNLCENHDVFKYKYDLLLFKALQTCLRHIMRNFKLLT